jgi:hypothetical protein
MWGQLTREIVLNEWAQAGLRRWRVGPMWKREFEADKWGSPGIRNWKLILNYTKFYLLEKLS